MRPRYLCALLDLAAIVGTAEAPAAPEMLWDRDGLAV